MMPTPKTAVKNNVKLTATELKDFMNLNGLSTKEFAEILGVTFQAVKLWLTAQRDISLTTTKVIRLFIRYPQLLREF